MYELFTVQVFQRTANFVSKNINFTTLHAVFSRSKAVGVFTGYLSLKRRLLLLDKTTEYYSNLYFCKNFERSLNLRLKSYVPETVLSR